jgi:hypothetical protein
MLVIKGDLDHSEETFEKSSDLYSVSVQLFWNWIQIRPSQNVPDPDPQHCFKFLLSLFSPYLLNFLKKRKLFQNVLFLGG